MTVRALALAVVFATAACDVGVEVPPTLPVGRLVLHWSGAKTKVALGAESKLRLWLRVDEHAKVSPPEVLAQLHGVEGLHVKALTHGQWSKRDGQRIWSRGYALQWLRLGEQKLAPITVEATIGDEKLEASSEELTFDVTSVLDKPETAPEVPNTLIADPPPVAWWPYALGAVLLVAIIWLVRRWRRSRPAPEAKIPVVYALAPDQRALDRLRDIERRLSEQRIGQDELVVEVSDTLRHFIQDGLGLQSLYQTSEEFLSAASTQIALPGTLALSVRGFLEQCDLVKFAAQRPSLELCQQLIATAREVVLSTRESAKPEPAEVADG